MKFILFFSDLVTSFDPREVIAPQGTTILLGEDLHLDCYASSFPPPAVTWLKDGAPITPTTRVKMVDEQLVVRRVTSLDEGRYTCVLSVGEKTIKRDAFIIIRG